MTNKELKKLTRTELLELLLAQTRRADELEKEVESLKSELSNKDIAISSSGSIAEAALKLNNVFEVAQAAADQYLFNVMQRNGADETELASVMHHLNEESNYDNRVNNANLYSNGNSVNNAYRVNNANRVNNNSNGNNYGYYADSTGAQYHPPVERVNARVPRNSGSGINMPQTRNGRVVVYNIRVSGEEFEE